MSTHTQKLFWIDLEMTGLDIEKEVIIEVAALISDMDFNVLDTYETVVKQPQQYLEKMDDWNKKHHTESGLVAKIPFGHEPEMVEEDLIQLALKHFKCSDRDTKPILAGNSISQDRLFIDKYFKKFSKLLHYRMLDVTSWKVIMIPKFGIEYKKKNSHRALDDIHESLAELKHYCTSIKKI